MTIVERVKNRKIGIVGMARSGLAAAKLAAGLGGEVFVSECKPARQVAEQTALLSGLNIGFETGGHSEQLLANDYLILSPGVPPTVPILIEAARRGLPMFSEIEFASWFCRGTIVAITGSNGKTTTTTLIGEIFKAAGRPTFVCGNIGLPFAEVSSQIPSEGIAVVEVSTFQLERIDVFKPHVAVILNLSPDHLDRHGDYQAYKKLKYRIAENQSAEDRLILNKQDQDSMSDAIDTAARKLYFTTEADQSARSFVRDGVLWVRREDAEVKVIACDAIRIRGPHNLQNAAAAVAVTSELDVAPESMREALKSFAGVEHRLELVDRVAGIDFINDSKATNVDSVSYALRSIDTPIHLVAGGLGKGASYAPLIEHGRGRIKNIILIGKARQEMFDQLGRHFPTQFADSLPEAVRVCFELAQPGETVLLSPACASFDMFENYEHRGRMFKQAVAELRQSENNAVIEDK
ncbi:MAG: UDP-N-acetylmuramoyl-L-alanine--D-glutamate ligase [bacterium]